MVQFFAAAPAAPAPWLPLSNPIPSTTEVWLTCEQEARLERFARSRMLAARLAWRARTACWPRRAGRIGTAGHRPDVPAEPLEPLAGGRPEPRTPSPGFGLIRRGHESHVAMR